MVLVIRPEVTLSLGTNLMPNLIHSPGGLVVGSRCNGDRKSRYPTIDDILP